MGGTLYSHTAVSPCGKKVFLPLNSKIAKSLSISGRSVITKSNTGGGEGKSETLGAKDRQSRGAAQRKECAGRHEPWNFPISKRLKAASESPSPSGQQDPDIISHPPHGRVRRKVIALDRRHNET